ncbi:DUF2232 domain-containing protein [bacterium]|nr:DUF2232 domain-containing protein [bacterium]
MIRIKTQDLTQNAVLIAVTVLLFILHKFIPLLGLIGTLFCTVPMILASTRNNFQQAILISAASFVLIIILMGLFSGVFFLFEFATIGLAISYSLKKNYSLRKLFTISTITVMISTIMLYMLLSMVFTQNELDPANIQKKLVRDLTSIKHELLGNFKNDPNLSPMDLKKLEESLDMIITKTREAHYYFPIMLIWASIFSTIITYMMTAIVLKRLKIEIPEMPPFDYFHIPWNFIWGLIAGGLLIKLNITFTITKIGENILYSFLMLYFITGLSIAKFFLKKSNLPVIFKGFLFISVMIFFQPIPFLLGLFDNLVDFRNIRISDMTNLKLYGNKRDITEI